MPSSVIRAFRYRPARRELDILFTTGRRYTYSGVPFAAFSGLRDAASKGRFFNARIRGHYPYREREATRRPILNRG